MQVPALDAPLPSPEEAPPRSAEFGNTQTASAGSDWTAREIPKPSPLLKALFHPSFCPFSQRGGAAGGPSVSPRTADPVM